jgi:hypothetical protein
VKPEPQFAQAIREAAAGYQKWGRVDEVPRRAPAPCAAPTRGDDGNYHVRTSAATEGPHAQKLYYLWASDKQTYLRNGPSFANGFAIVKQSFAMPSAAGAEVGEPKDLFVIAKVGGAGTDEGWIYGTVAVDGTVTSAGRVASCMGCHDEGATHERLFGLAKP